MNLREAMLEEHSKAQTDKIVRWVGTDAGRLRALMHLFMTDEYRVVQRSAWVVAVIAHAHPQLIEAYLPGLVEKLSDTEAHIAVRRNIFRIFDATPIPEALHEPLMHHSFEALEDPKEALAVRAFAIGILSRLTCYYPELKNELRIILEDFLQHEQAPSFKSRAVKALKKMTGKM